MREIRPRLFTRETASCACSRTTFGTFTVDLWPLSRVSSHAATRPPITSASSSSNHGQSKGRGGGSGGGGGGSTSSSTTATGGPSSTTVVCSGGSASGSRRILTSAFSPFAANPEPVAEEIFAIRPKRPNARTVYWAKQAPSTEVPMVRKLIVLALALGVGLA